MSLTFAGCYTIHERAPREEGSESATSETEEIIMGSNVFLFKFKQTQAECHGLCKDIITPPFGVSFLLVNKLNTYNNKW